MKGGNLYNLKIFASKFLYVRLKSGLTNKLIFNADQEYINNLLHEQKNRVGKIRAIILKGRQIGVSTYLSARCYHNGLINKGIKSLILTHRRSATNNLFDMIFRYYDNSPTLLKPKTHINRYKSIIFSETDSSYSFATAGSNELGRSDTIQFFHGSEVAFWKNSDNHLSSILMAIPDASGTEVILESTSNGASGMFYNMCMEAFHGDSEYQLIFLPWYWHEDYVSEEKILFSKEWLDYAEIHKLSLKQLAWAYLKNKTLCISTMEDYKLPNARFHREFPGSVLEAFKYSATNSLIPLEKIMLQGLEAKFYDQQTISQSIKDSYFLGKSREIILGVDIARGGGDLSWIIDRQGYFIGFNVNEKVDFADTMEVVAWISKYIVKLQPFKVCIDAGGGGVGVYDRLCEIGYKNIAELVYFGSKARDSRKYFNKRAELWGNLQEFITQGGYIIKDEILLRQISSLEFYYTSTGQIKLESKDDLKKRLKASPDGADACSLTFAHQCDSKLIINTTNNHYDFKPFDW